LLDFLVLRIALAMSPFAVWFLWREIVRRSGRQPRAAPWAWLYALSALLFGQSLMSSALFRVDNRGEHYVPAEATSGGHVTPGHFEKAAPQKP
jgi:hypothetical protein